MATVQGFLSARIENAWTVQLKNNFELDKPLLDRLADHLVLNGSITKEFCDQVKAADSIYKRTTFLAQIEAALPESSVKTSLGKYIAERKILIHDRCEKKASKQNFYATVRKVAVFGFYSLLIVGGVVVQPHWSRYVDNHFERKKADNLRQIEENTRLINQQLEEFVRSHNDTLPDAPPLRVKPPISDTDDQNNMAAVTVFVHALGDGMVNPDAIKKPEAPAQQENAADSSASNKPDAAKTESNPVPVQQQGGLTGYQRGIEARAQEHRQFQEELKKAENVVVVHKDTQGRTCLITKPSLMTANRLGRKVSCPEPLKACLQYKILPGKGKTCIAFVTKR